MSALANLAGGILLEALGLAFEHHHHGSSPGGDVQRLVGRIQNENLAHASPLVTRHANDPTKAFSVTLSTQTPPEPSPRQRAWVEVSPSAIEANARALLAHLAGGTTLMAVVKADGYGHGAETVARAALRGGATSLGVATLEEGISLRRAGIDAPVLLLGNLIEAEDLRCCLHWRLMPTLSSLREAQICGALANGSGRRFQVQLKLDTGMTRLGCDWKEGPAIAEAIQGLPELELCGLYSHLACADERNDAFTSQQHSRFQDVLEQLPDRGRFLCRHLANSAGTMRDPALHHDLVRVGLALYGHAPADHLDGLLPLQPALSVRARVTLIRQVPAGVGVSYGQRFVSDRPCRLAVVSIGYADGVMRSLSGRIHALHNGRMLPQVGAITMDQLMLDATAVPDLERGSIVTLLGCDGNAKISPHHWSERCDSIPWEILCGFKRRLPRLEV